MSYRLGIMDIYEPSFELCFSDDAFDENLLSAMSTQQSSSCTWDASVFDMPSEVASTENHVTEPQPPIPSQSQLPSSFDTIDSSMSSPGEILNNGNSCTSLTPKFFDLNLGDGSKWPMPCSEPDMGIIPLNFSYDAADGLQSWQEAAYVPHGLEIADVATDDPEVMNCAVPEPVVDGSEMQQPVDSEQQRARDFWFGTETNSSEPMFNIVVPLTPSASEDSLLIVTPDELSSDSGSPTTTVFTDMSDSSDEQASSSSPSPENTVPATEGERKKLPGVAPGGSPSEVSSVVDKSFCLLTRRKTDKLAARRKHKRRVSPSDDTRSEGRKSPPFRKIDQMDPLSRQLLDEILLNDRMPPIGKPIPYSVIMVRLRHLYCGAEETLRGHFRRLTKPKEQRVRKPVWKPNDVRLLEEAVKLYLDATTKRKISWTAVGDYIFANGGSYKFGVTACSKKWYSLSKSE
ncbi:hypothetical protein CP533_1003 [Ophiocordyceps camponoti-saundersi (nom. inval.)]|nr:hypothetical protein CP533_1003 [Ophiocordyceps camponoti-saundersi (nom. inval.)]